VFKVIHYLMKWNERRFTYKLLEPKVFMTNVMRIKIMLSKGSHVPQVDNAVVEPS
jgi:hypothetical protein